MADEPQVIRGIDWKATFPFVSLFRGFRVAIHPSKLILALVALMLIYFGGKVLDGIWPRDYRAADYAHPALILMGNEQQGLPRDMAELCDVNVKIPMRGRADSLNLSVATGIMIYAAT